MRQCPECREYIGEELNSCPYCKHVITMAEVLQEEDEQKKKDAELEMEAILEYDRRVASRRKIFALYTLYIIVVGIIAVNFHFGEFAVFMAILPGVVLAWASSMSHKADMCPYCDKYIYRRGYTYINSHCPYCGKRIR